MNEEIKKLLEIIVSKDNLMKELLSLLRDKDKEIKKKNRKIEELDSYIDDLFK